MGDSLDLVEMARRALALAEEYANEADSSLGRTICTSNQATTLAALAIWDELKNIKKELREIRSAIGKREASAGCSELRPLYRSTHSHMPYSSGVVPIISVSYEFNLNHKTREIHFTDLGR